MSEPKQGSTSEPMKPYSASKHAIQGAGENVAEAGAAVNKAKDSMKALLDGKANVVDTALAVKGAIDNVKGLAGRLSATAMMPVLKALSAFKGKAVLPAGKQMDPVMGIDVHMVTIPPSPAPVPLPHPYIGMLFNPKDWVSCLINTFKKDALDTLPPPAEDDKGVVASVAKNKEMIAGIAMGIAGMSASVKFGGMIPRAVTGTKTKNISHIPMGAGFHPGFAASVAKNHGKAFLGSLFVVADGDPMVGSFHLNYDCWDVGVVDLFKSTRNGAKKAPEAGSPQAQLYVPSGTVMPIPIGRPVLVNSIPTPINPLTILDKLFKCGLGKLKAAGRRAAQKGLDKLNGKVGCGPLTRASKLVGTGQSHPVDVAGGHFYTDNIDFSLPGPIPLKWERTWYSYSNYKGPLGYGWHHSYDMALAFDNESDTIILRLSDGRTAKFDLPLVEEAVFNRSEKMFCHLHEEGYHYVTDKENLIYRFTKEVFKNRYNNTETHLLQSIANRNGFAIRFSYDAEGLLNKITDSAGRRLLVKSDNSGRITSIHAPHPDNIHETFPIASYSYTTEGDMSEHSDALNQPMRYEYVNHLMVNETWRNGLTWHFKYDKAVGIDAKCVEVCGDGDLLRYKFDYSNPECTVATNSLGYKKIFHHRNGVVVKYIDPTGGQWMYVYNRFNEMERQTDPLGNEKNTVYDEYGNVIFRSDENGAFTQIEFRTPGFWSLPSNAVDNSGGKWVWHYDTAGNLVKRIDPVNAITTYQYSNGLLTSIINAAGNKSLVDYDEMGNVIRLTSSNGNTISWDYDRLGSCIRTADPAGKKTSWKFDMLMRLETIHEPNDNIILFKYDAAGNIINVKDKRDEISFGYNPLNKLSLRYQSGKKVRFNYNKEGFLTEVINEAGSVYKYELDANGRVIKEVRFDNVSRSLTRDLAGRITQVLKPNGKTTNYKYDNAGNVIEISFADGNFQKYKYRADGHLIQVENQHAVINLERDILGQVIKETCNGNHVTVRYDVFGNRTHLASNLGADISNRYDDLGNLVEIITAQWASLIKYDKLSFEVERLMPGGIKCETIRDKFGRPTIQKISKEAGDSHNRQYTWDIKSRLQRILDTNTGTTQFDYDAAGNLTKTIFDDNSIQYRIPNIVGNLFRSVDQSDRVYDRAGKLLKANGNTYRYDEEGNLIEKKQNGESKWIYKWNQEGMLEEVIRPDGESIEFRYDGLGRRIYKRYKNTITKWFWDNNKPLHEWKEHAVTGEMLSNAAVDGKGIITWMFEENSFSPISKLKEDKQYSIVTDHLGTPFQMYQQDGEKFWEAALDSYGNPKMVKGDKGSCPFRFQGQYEDVETGLYYNRFRYYMPEEGVYMSPDPIRLQGGMELYNYVHDPNTFIDKFGLSCETEINPVTGRPKGELQKLASEIRAAGKHPITQNNRVIAVGMGPDGKLYAASSNGFDAGQRKKADELGIQRVPTKADKHAEESLVAAVPEVKSVGTSRRDPCGPDEHNCAKQLEDKGIDVDNL
jgi:RHS repeat-associated protein